MTKQEYVNNLTATPSKEMLEALFNFEGTIQEYFLHHQRGTMDAFWYLKNGGNIPEIFNEEVCLQVVKLAKQNGEAIRYLTDEQRTLKVCLEAVKQNGYNIRYINNKKRTNQVCLEAVKQDGYAIIYLT